MATQVYTNQLLNMTAGAVSASSVVDLAALDHVTLQAIYTNATTSAKTFVYLSGNSVTMTAHGQTTGSVGQLTTTVALPTGLSTSTNYYLIIIDANTVQFATSLANAVAGTAVVLTGAGSGTQTFTPTTLSGTLACYHNNDAVAPVSTSSTRWTAVPNTTATITSTGTTFWSSNSTVINSSVTTKQIEPDARWLLVLFTPTSGQLTMTVGISASRDS